MLRAVATRVKAYEAADTVANATLLETPELRPTFAPTAPSPRALAALGLAMPEAKALFAPRVVASLSAQRRRSFASIHTRVALFEGRIDDVAWGPGTAAFGAASVTSVPNDVMLGVNAKPSGFGKSATSTHSSATCDTFAMSPLAAIPPSSLPGLSREGVRDPSRGPALAERLRSRIDSAGAFLENAGGVSRFDNAQTMLFNALGAPQRPVSAPFFKGERNIVAPRDDEAAFADAQRRALKKYSAIARESVLEAENRAMIASVDAANAAAIAAAAAVAADDDDDDDDVVPRHSRLIRNISQSRKSSSCASTLKRLAMATLVPIAPTTSTIPSRMYKSSTKE